MGIDTRYWGPSGWQLFHYIAFHSKSPQQFLLGIKDILPCKFCRESTTKFTHELPMSRNAGKWVYELHNKVNHKLRSQCKDDPAVIDPGPDPTFEEVKQKYETMKLEGRVLGRDFLFSISANYPEKPEPEQMATQRTFLKQLAEVYPTNFETYLEEHSPALESHKDYMKWMYGLLSFLASKSHATLPSYKGYVQRLMYYRSGCDKKTYRGKTCRRLNGGGRTKARDHRKTYRVSHSVLL
jgi:hypothetical protein